MFCVNTQYRMKMVKKGKSIRKKIKIECMYFFSRGGPAMLSTYSNNRMRAKIYQMEFAFGENATFDVK